LLVEIKRKEKIMTTTLPNIFTIANKGNGIILSPLKMRKYLEKKGFAQFMTSEDRTAKRFYVQDDNNVLKIHNADTIKHFIIKEVEKCIDGEDLESKLEEDAENLLNAIARRKGDMIENQVLKLLPVTADIECEDASEIKLATDTNKKSYFRFKNGVVVVTAEDIKLVEYADLKDEGLIWESNIIKRNITLDNAYGGLFEKFAVNALKVRDEKLKGANDDWTSEYPLTPSVITNLESLKSALGYLIQRDNTDQKCVVFVDRDSTPGSENGGNGKTFVMDAIKHFTGVVQIDGKQLFNNGGTRFAYENVTPATGLIHIDETDAKFDFKNLFSVITGDFVVDGKGKKKIIITEDKKPKFGITTNYILSGKGNSHTRRQHIVEFGNYWNACEELHGEHPSDEKHLGKMLFQRDFTDQDWNQFYMFGFRCVQLYLKDGLKKGSKGTYEEKRILTTCVPKSPEVQQFFYDYVLNKRVAYGHFEDGVADYALYALFTSQVGENIAKYWDITKFKKTLFSYVSQLEGYDWNPEKSHKGDTLKSRLVRVGSRDNQVSVIKIVHANDNDDKNAFFEYLYEVSSTYRNLMDAA
jgi:hypothetical protein